MQITVRELVIVTAGMISRLTPRSEYLLAARLAERALPLCGYSTLGSVDWHRNAVTTARQYAAGQISSYTMAKKCEATWDTVHNGQQKYMLDKYRNVPIGIARDQHQPPDRVFAMLLEVLDPERIGDIAIVITRAVKRASGFIAMWDEQTQQRNICITVAKEVLR